MAINRSRKNSDGNGPHQANFPGDIEAEATTDAADHSAGAAATDQGAARIYTKGGDKGKTSLVGGTRVSKADLRLDAYGSIDEFNSSLGLAVALFLREASAAPGGAPARAVAEKIRAWAGTAQSRLFDVGSQLACEDNDLRSNLPAIAESSIAELEAQMDEMSKSLKPLKNFIMPSGAPSAAAAHVARTVCRRAERLCARLAETAPVDPLLFQFINRCSDWCFVLARFMNAAFAQEEHIWKPR
jgi:cob(I)alamin adenosyltransferase